MQDILNVQQRVAEFVAAARQSEESYTVRDLQEMVELEFLEETGGFANWIKRKLTGIDDAALEEIQAAVDGITTEQEREKALRSIDDLLKECEEIAGRGAGRHAVTAAVGGAALKLSGLFGGQGLMGKAITKTAGGVGAVAGRMIGSVFGSVIPGMKDGGAKGALVLGKVGEYSIAAYGALKIAQVIARVYVSKDGTMDDYIAALRAVRKEIEDKKLKSKKSDD